MPVDIKLLKACMKNEQKAQEELYEACFLFLMPICMRFHRNENDARAIYNVAFLKIVDNLSTTDFTEVPFVAWARRVMRNALIDEYRMNRKYNEKISNRDNEREIEYHAKDAVRNAAESKFNEDSILNLLDELKPDTKRVFILYAIEGYAHKEIAEIMDIPVGTSKWHLSLARKELKELLKAQQKNVHKNVAI